ncbi:MAG: hypoxanthine phosphoribosyltransferase [Phycisphaerae bacterium]|nr:hypoxanthine phosphoribosyltransferase [Phycisphaerae bacterium]NUQ45424.1 hypoxanthine phosphoribosyltransferase [Phycisphaerae bacterium]
MRDDIERTLISSEDLARRVRELADEIAATYAGRPDGLVIVPILSGSVIFLADLIRCMPFKMRVGLMAVSSYRGATTQSRGARVLQPLGIDITDRHVLVLDDILDTGNTLRLVVDQLKRQNPASLRVCVLLRKPNKAPKSLQVDFVGFDIEDVFVVGYGLDYNDLYRNWPGIGVLKRELYA